ncbi:ATP-binding protein [Vibrio alginolyticus]|uniref:AAA family ATPase n=1 Tax=Vibrio alginolyticus TaxID=663 RepID=UPI003753AEF2
MRINDFQIDDNIYLLSEPYHNTESQSENTYTVIIGKNGTGKSRLLSSVAEAFNKSQRNFTNHAVIKNKKQHVMTFENNGRNVKYLTGKGSKNQLIIERNSWVKNNSPSRVIAASTSPFDKFPTLSDRKKSKSIKRNFYKYVGLKQGVNSLSDEHLINSFVQSMLSTNSSLSVSKTLNALGFQDYIKVSFNHDLRKRYANRDKEKFKDYATWLADDDYIHYAARTINNESLNHQILNSLAFKAAVKAKVAFMNSNKSTSNFEDYVQHDLFFPFDNLPKTFTFGEQEKKEVRNAIKESVFNGLSQVTSIMLKRKDGMVFDIKDSSSGERSLLLLVCSIANEIRDNSLILIDEPELSLHPAWQEEFISIISEVFNSYKGCHFIMATHSPLVISQLKARHCFVVNMDENKTYKSDEFVNKSTDYQLAHLFKIPGESNEYLKRLCLNLLTSLSKGEKLSKSLLKESEILFEVESLISDDDSIKELIKIIKKGLELSNDQ